MKGFSTKNEEARDLVKLRVEVEAFQLLDAKSRPWRWSNSPKRVSRGQLSKAWKKRLQLVEGVCVEERIGENFQSIQLIELIVVFVQSRRYPRVPQQLQPLFAPALLDRQKSESEARVALYTEEAVLFSDVASPLVVPGLGFKV